MEHNHVFANGGSSALGAGVGILILNSARVTVANNRSENNGSNGIALNGASRNVVRGNRSDGNTVAGIGLNGASDNLLEKNAISRNGQDGVRIANASDRNIVRLNLVLRHTRDGIRVVDAASDENRIEWNAVRESGEHDAHDDSVGPRTGGTANFWIKNHCKTQNRPGLCARSFETHE